jgi:hypothetical protein
MKQNNYFSEKILNYFGIHNFPWVNGHERIFLKSLTYSKNIRNVIGESEIETQFTVL